MSDTVNMSTAENMDELIAEAYACLYKVFLGHWQVARLPVLDFIQGQLMETFAGRKEVAALSVGCGSGDFDIQIIELLQRLTGEPAMTYVAIEPNPFLRREFEDRTLDGALKEVTFDIHPAGIETFQTERRFDFIHFTHSLYHMVDSKSAIRDAVNMLKENGCLMIVLSAPGGMSELIDTFWEEINSVATTDETASRGDVTALAVKETLDQLNLTYAHENFPETIDVSECFQDGSLEGQYLLSFLYQSDLSDISPELKRRLLGYLERQCAAQAPRKLLNEESVAFLIFRPSATAQGGSA